MTPEVVEKNLDILRKLRLLNLEINKLVYNDLSGVLEIYNMKRNVLVEEKEGVLSSISYKNAEIEKNQLNIEGFTKCLNEFKSTKNFDCLKDFGDLFGDYKIEESDVFDILDLEIKIAKRNIFFLENEIKLLNNQISHIDEEIKKLDDIFRPYEEKDSGEREDFKKKINGLYTAVNELKELLSKDIMEQYNELSSGFIKGDLRFPVASIVDNCCENCNIEIPLQRKLDIRKKDDFIKCENCGCFFVD